MRKWLLTALLPVVLAVPALAANPIFDYDREFYPYYPSLIKWNKSGAPFTEPETCRQCHPKQFREWNGSVHALAFHDPIYQGELNKAVKAVGREISRQCEGCHSPAGMVTGEIRKPGLEGLSPMAKAGVSCDICHSISGTTHWQTPSHEPENGSFILSPGIDGKDEPVLIKRGPVKGSAGCGSGFHDCVESPLHLQADLCAGCHQVYHHDSHFPLEATFLEWKHGPYAQKGILCQDCHMVETDVFLKTADAFRKPERGEYRHYFSGANFVLYFLAEAAAKKAGDEDLAAAAKKKFAMAVEKLQSAADLEIEPVYRGGKLAEVRVRVKNVRAGHNLPTSLTNVRQMWLEVTARDAAGTLLFSSGEAAKDGSLPADTRMFNSDGMGKDFHFAIDPWVVTAFSRHDTIPPRGYKEVYYGITLPADTKSVSFEAKLRFRQADQRVAEALLSAVPADMNLEKLYGLKEIPAVPVVDMVQKSAVLPAAR